jgi:hypothetical protein
MKTETLLELELLSPERLREILARHSAGRDTAQALTRRLQARAASVVAQAMAKQKQEQALARASHALGWVERVVPKHVADEELGDALEVIGQMVAQRYPRWQVYLKVTATVFWLLVNALRARWFRHSAPSARR